MGSTTGLRSDSFPAGLRVLLVDHDSACLQNLHKMLLKCKYQVSMCKLAQEALDLLENGKDGFDIVMSDVNVPDMDGFKFLEQVGLKMDLPVIMMSVDGETSRVMKGVEHGACDYLLKPIRMKEVRNIWQHVFRKRIHQERGGGGAIIESKESLISAAADDSCSSFSEDNNDTNKVTGKKRKDHVDSNTNNESSDPSSSSLKKARVVWSYDLHQKFVKAINRIGLDKAGPKKILDLMGVPWLTRENVASHLQKYRLYLSRMQRENETLKAAAYGGPSERPNLVTLQQNIVINENYAAAAAGQEIHIHSHTSSTCEGNVAGILSMPMQAEGEKLMFGDVSDPPISSSSRIGYNHPFELLKSESKIQAHYTWNGGAPSSHLKQHHHRHNHFPLVPHNHGTLRQEADQHQEQPMEANINHFYSKNRSYAIGADHHTAAAIFSVPQQGYLTRCQTPLEQVSRSTWSTNNHDEEQNNLEASLKNLIVGTGSAAAALRLREVELNPYSSAGDIYLQNPQLVNLESFGCSNQDVLVSADTRAELYDSNNVEDEYDSNGVEFYVNNQGLYFG